MSSNRSNGRLTAVAMAFLMVASVASAVPVAGDAALGVTTEAATNATDAGATLQGNVTELDDVDSATVYFTYWKAGQKDETLAWWTGDATSSPGSFSATVSLDAGTTYEYRAYAESSDGSWKAGSVREVTTSGRSLGVETGRATDVASSSATVAGNLTGLGGADSATLYVEYWPEGNDSETYWWTGDATSSPGSFAAELGLAPGTTYEYRALARSSDGHWTRGEVHTVTTPSHGFDVTTEPPSSVGVESATVGGNLTDLGRADSATVYVKYWRQGHDLETTWWTGDSRTSPGEFEATLDLRPGTTYEYRTFARSGDGHWKAGEVETLATDGEPFGVATGIPDNVTHDSATVSPTLAGLGGADSATVYVQYWETDRKDETSTWWTGPTVSEPGEFETTLDLRSETSYYVKALARDDDGRWTAGSVHSFTTDGEPSDGEPPQASYEVRLVSPTDDFENARPLDSEDTVTFNASESHDPDGEVVGYEWDFDGDREADATGEVVTHSFPEAGDYPVRLTVTDDDGNARSYDREVRVGERVADTIYAVNAGGPRLFEGHGDLVGHPNWAPDTASDPSPYANHDESGSHVLEADSIIDGHDVSEPPFAPNSMYETVREAPEDGEPMRYSFDVEPGRTYEVRVFFTEVEIKESDYDGGERRVFDVTVDGETLANDLDTYGERAHDGGGSHVSTVTADDDTLTVEFQSEQGDPVVSGIEILRVGDGEGS